MKINRMKQQVYDVESVVIAALTAQMRHFFFFFKKKSLILRITVVTY